MAHVAYARVSSLDQHLDIQLAKLAFCEKVFTDKQTGTTQQRPGLQACLTYLREGDVLVITRLDRLARSTLDLCRIATDLKDRGIDFQVLDQHFDTSTITGRLTFHVLAAIAEFETALRAERQKEGIAKARSEGIRFGHPHQLTPAQVTALRQQRQSGVLIKTLMAQYHLSKASIYRYLQTTAPTLEMDTAAD